MLIHQFLTEQRFMKAAAYAFIKLAEASPPKAVMVLKGKLVESSSGWLLLDLPNAIGHGLFEALDDPTAELPKNSAGRYNCHVSVVGKDELKEIGGAKKVKEIDQTFKFQIGPVQTVEPDGWPEMSRVYFCAVESPELGKLRESYGLSRIPGDGKKKFHLTLAVVRRKGADKDATGT